MRRAVDLALDAGGAALFALATWATLADLYQPIGIYDEALLLTNADAILHGAAPYRDFYSNYPPGLFYLLAGIWKLFGIHALAARWLGLAIHLGLALACGVLAGRLLGRRFLPLAAGLVMTALVPLHLVANAYLAAVATLLAAIALLLAGGARLGWRRGFAAGLLLGVTSALRHDVFLMFVAAVGGCAALAWLARRWRPPRAAALALALGTALPVALVWLPTFARAGLAVVAGDLYFDQVRYVLPARTLPFPPLLEATSHPWLPFSLPAFLASPFAAGFVAAFAGLLLALAGASTLYSRRRARPDAFALLLLAIACGVGVFHMLGRTDFFHVLFALPVPLILFSALAQRGARHGPLGALGGALLVLWLLQPGALPTQATQRLWPPASLRAPPPASTLESPRVGPVLDPAARARREILAFIHTHAAPDEPVFVGQPQHDRVILNDLLLYFLADRRGATRYQQFDPGLVTRAEAQREMIADLEAKRPPVVVLTPRWFAVEPNRSQERGARLLDEYIASRYELARRVGRYQLLLRK